MNDASNWTIYKYTQNKIISSIAAYNANILFTKVLVLAVAAFSKTALSVSCLLTVAAPGSTPGSSSLLVVNLQLTSPSCSDVTDTAVQSACSMHSCLQTPVTKQVL